MRSNFRRELAAASRPRPAAELLAAGVSPGALRGPRWRRTSHGFYVPAERQTTGSETGWPRAPTPAQRILDASPLVPPAGALGGWAAAYVEGVGQLDGLDPYTMSALPLLIYLGRDVGRRRDARVRYSRERLSVADVAATAGLIITAPPRTAFDGARLADNLAEAVAFLDAYAHSGRLHLPTWGHYVSQHPGWEGVAQARAAAELADAAARSTWESRLRVFYVVEAGLPRPEVNIPIFDRDGNLLGIPDLLDPAAGLVTEFDGGLHRERSQHRHDNAREELFESHGLTVVRVDSLDMGYHHRALTHRLQDGRRRGLARDPRRDKWTVKEPDWWLDQADPGSYLTDADRDDLYG